MKGRTRRATFGWGAIPVVLMMLQLGALGSLGALAQPARAEQPWTIPSLQEWKDAAGSYTFGANTRIVVDPASAGALSTTASLFRGELAVLTGLTVPVVITLVTLSIGLTAPAGARGTLDEILGKVDRTAQAAKQISVVTQQQRTASDQIVAGMRELADVIKQTADGMKPSSVAAGELNQLAVELKARVSAFQVT